MGVDITHIIRHEFRDVKNHAASVEFVMKDAVNSMRVIYNEEAKIELPPM